MRLYLAIATCKLASYISKLLKKDGTVIGGYLALKICPNALSKIKYPKYVIGVTGSSGKGSTTQEVAHILKDNNYSIAYNANGSNVMNAIASLIFNNSTNCGVFKKDVLLMEMDEKYSVKVLKNFDLTHLIVTNVTRDQPPRNTHPEFISNEISKIIKDNTHLILNADDPIVTKLSINHKGPITYYGVDKNDYAKETTLNNLDAAYCPICNNKLKYTYYHYGHIGNYKCPKCNFKRPTPDFLANNIDVQNKIIYINKEKVNLTSNFLYSVYFTTASYALCSVIGLTKDQILHSLNINQVKHKRLNIYNIDKNRFWQMLVSKNENNLSYKQSIEFIIHEPGIKTIVLGFDNSSRRYEENDISWIWDIDFEELNDKSIDKIIIIGRFKYDVLTRLEYANIPKEKLILIDNLELEIMSTIKNETKGNIYSMVCFDKEIELKEILKKEGIKL